MSNPVKFGNHVTQKTSRGLKKKHTKKILKTTTYRFLHRNHLPLCEKNMFYTGFRVRTLIFLEYILVERGNLNPMGQTRQGVFFPKRMASPPEKINMSPEKGPF